MRWSVATRQLKCRDGAGSIGRSAAARPRRSPARTCRPATAATAPAAAPRSDLDGLRLALVDLPGIEAEPAWTGGDVAAEHAIPGFRSVSLMLDRTEATGAILRLATEHGLRTTEQKDRDYFRSVHCREPGGVLSGIATDIPGFAVDGPANSLDAGLKLPRVLEGHRGAIETALSVLA